MYIFRISSAAVFTLNVRTGLSKQCRPRSDAAEQNAKSDLGLHDLPLQPTVLNTSTGSKMFTGLFKI